MAAKVTKEFPGVRDGETQVTVIKVGEIIHGELARVALEQKWAEEVAGEAAAPGIKTEDDLSEYSVDELKTLARKRKVELGSARTKAEIVAAIQAASES